MKKSLMTLIAVVAIVAVTGIVIAEEKEEKQRGKRGASVEQRERSARSDEARAESQKRRMQGVEGPGGREGRGPMDREAMMKQRTKMLEDQNAKERKTHEAFVGELKAIKKLADKEGAEKTSARLQKLIAQTNKKFEAKVKAQKDRMQRYMQGSGRGDTMRRPRGGAEGEAAVRGRGARPGTEGEAKGKARGPKAEKDKE